MVSHTSDYIITLFQNHKILELYLHGLLLKQKKIKIARQKLKISFLWLNIVHFNWALNYFLPVFSFDQSLSAGKEYKELVRTKRGRHTAIADVIEAKSMVFVRLLIFYLN